MRRARIPMRWRPRLRGNNESRRYAVIAGYCREKNICRQVKNGAASVQDMGAVKRGMA